MRCLLNLFFFSVLISCNNNSKKEPQKINIPDSLISYDSNIVKEKKPYIIARVDTGNQRVFVVIDSLNTNKQSFILTIVKEISQQYKPWHSLNISFITGAKYAGYKDELESKYGISFWEFYNNYLGEYDKLSKEYWTYPVLPDRKTKYLMDIGN